MTDGKVDKQIYAEVVLRSKTGTSLMKNTAPLDAKKLFFYQAEASDVEEACKKLSDAGFSVIARSQFGISIVGTGELYKKYFNTEIVQRPVKTFYGREMAAEINPFFMNKTPEVPVELAPLVDTLYIPPTGYFLSGEGQMPALSYYHLRPPADISRLTNADAAHTRGFRGTGVKVAMIDSGFVADHDYYSGRGYNITVHAAVGDSTKDEIGHGTGIASNLLAIAPECEFHFVKMIDGYNWASVAAFRLAVSLGVKVITCSWGQPRDPVLEAEIQAAVKSGITVVFACGNGCPIGWPGCMPEVISVGGAYPRQDGTWEAATYASSGVNSLYPNRHCPDISGIVGHLPHGIFIVMPTQKGAEFDGLFSGSNFPNGDETGSADGWLVASGTSSAAPMVAGGAALLLNAKSSLTPAEIKQTLMDTAIDVTQGFSPCGTSVGAGSDSATGAGMIDIGAAVNKVAPSVCLRAPQIICLRAPQIICPAPTCPRGPIQCLRGPIQCLRGPIQCLRGPIQCLRGPTCPLAPVCHLAPSRCLPAPIMPPACPGPIVIPPVVVPESEDPLVPVTIMVPKSTAEAWMTYGKQDELSPEDAHQYALQAAEEAYCAALEELGMAGEYSGFPSVKGCKKGAFDPSAKE